MSKSHNKGFTFIPTQPTPKLKRIKTSWDLKALYYKGSNDPQIEKDVLLTEKTYRNFAKKYRNSKFTTDANVLLRALTELERIAAMPQTSKPGRYFSFRSALDSKDTEAEKRLNLLSDRLTKAGNEMVFFNLALGKIPKKKQREFLADKRLASFRYYLERTFLEATHDLSEAEERILNLTSGPAYGMWVSATEKIISNRSISYKGKDIPLNTAIEMINTLSSKEKPKLWSIITAELKGISEIVENEITAIVTDKKVLDDLRKYERPYSATVESYEDDLASVEALISAVSTKGFALSRKFYELKARAHGKKQLEYVQKYDALGKAPTIPFAQAVEIARDVFYGVKTEYGEIFDGMLHNGQIDVYPKKGKQGGAFMSSSINLPTKVFLNHTDDFKSLETLAHEMGHAIHSERSKVQPPFYQGHSTSTAETASTLFENLLFDAVYKDASESQKPILLHDRIGRDIATIQRQIAFFNFELEMHKAVRENGAVTKEELRDMMKKHLTSYLGKGVNVTDEDGYSYVYISHFRYGFYVYTYAFGILMSTVMANHFKRDRSYVEKIDQFLCLGSSDSVPNIFKMIGINTRKPDAFIDGLTTHESHIKEFERFVKGMKR